MLIYVFNENHFRFINWSTLIANGLSTITAWEYSSAGSITSLSKCGVVSSQFDELLDQNNKERNMVGYPNHSMYWRSKKIPSKCSYFLCNMAQSYHIWCFKFCHRKIMFDFFGLHSKLSCDNVFIYGFWSLSFWKNPPSLFSSTCVGQLSWAEACWMQALHRSKLKVLKIHFMKIKVVTDGQIRISLYQCLSSLLQKVESFPLKFHVANRLQLPRFFRMAACSMTKDTAIKSSASIKTEVQRDLEWCQPMVLNKNAERLWVDNDIAYMNIYI